VAPYDGQALEVSGGRTMDEQNEKWNAEGMRSDRGNQEPSTPMRAAWIALAIVIVGILIFVIVASIIVANLGDPTF
jgi:uncharacterized integral membrane protein